MRIALTKNVSKEVAESLLSISAHVEAKRAIITTKHCNKMMTYYIKYLNAQKILLNDPVAISRLQPEATWRGMSVVDLANLIVAKYDFWTDWAFKMDMLEYSSLSEFNATAFTDAASVFATLEATKIAIDDAFVALLADLPQ